MKRFPLLLILLFSTIMGFAGNKPLPTDKAFQLNAAIAADHTVQLLWNIAPGYHLYRERVNVALQKPTDASLGHILKPAGIAKIDKTFGTYEVYTDNTTLAVPVLNAEKPIQLNVQYQGCATDGFCYPPELKHFNVDFQANTISIVKPHAVSAQTHITQILVQHSFVMVMLAFFGFGLLLAFTPCVLPLLPILSSIILGEGDSLKAKRAFWLSCSYVLGMAIAYASAGVLAAVLGNSIQSSLQNPWVVGVFSLMFIALALSLFGLYEFRLPSFFNNTANRLSNQQRRGSFLGTAVMGALSVLIASPCVTPPLIGALAYIGHTGNLTLGGSALFALGLGMGAPLIAFGTLGGKFLPKTGKWMLIVKYFFGLVLLVLAAWMFLRVIPTDATQNNRLFTPVKTVAALQQQLTAAKAQHQPVLLEYYASWCPSCQELEHKVFSQDDVRAALKAYRLLRIDVTKNTDTVNALKRDYHVIGPPVMIFFDANGKRLPEKRLVGAMSKQQFLVSLP